MAINIQKQVEVAMNGQGHISRGTVSQYDRRVLEWRPRTSGTSKRNVTCPATIGGDDLLKATGSRWMDASCSQPGNYWGKPMFPMFNSRRPLTKIMIHKK